MSANNIATKRGGFKSEKENMVFSIEHDKDGNATGYLVAPILSSLEESRNKMNQEAAKKDPIAAKAIRARWYKDNYKLDDEMAQDAYLSAFNTFLSELANNKEITSTAASNLIANAQSKKKTPWKELTREILDGDTGEVMQEAMITKVADKIYAWGKILIRIYILSQKKYGIIRRRETFIKTTLGAEYIGQPFYIQYKKLEESNHPYAKLYLLLQRSSRETDSKIPYGFYVKNRLPGVSMNVDERMRLSKNPLKVLKGELSQGFLVKADDDFRNTHTATDADGKKLNFTCILYKRIA